MTKIQDEVYFEARLAFIDIPDARIATRLSAERQVIDVFVTRDWQWLKYTVSYETAIYGPLFLVSRSARKCAERLANPAQQMVNLQFTKVPLTEV